MIAPDLRRIFDLLEYANYSTPEITALENKFGERLNSRMTPQEADEIYAAASDLTIESRYLGFAQGFDLARTLMSGRLI